MGGNKGTAHGVFLSLAGEQFCASPLKLTPVARVMFASTRLEAVYEDAKPA